MEGKYKPRGGVGRGGGGREGGGVAGGTAGLVLGEPGRATGSHSPKKLS